LFRRGKLLLHLTMRIRFVIFILLFASVAFAQPGRYYMTNTGKVSFSSKAQEELISASSNRVRGIIDVQNRTYVFKVLIRTFRGFNSELQKEHFNEKYLESDKFPEAIFTGKIIEDIDFNTDGIYEIRSKGKLSIHGIEKERIIKNTITIKEGVIKVESLFNILLSDYNIKIPKVVHEKIASEINIEVNLTLTKR
jgi:hypothetical protein